ncbi:uncharacterized protein [Chelonus insularis]|uniref:uncharacterized protein n=1 Tax=Chelonus insularis TaxID=460826 RepID=UPI00158EAF79|nr:uncharacterized protein LOC118067825 [Chelonus insularis]
MEGLYPSLQEKFKSEGICPICMMTMESTLKYSCMNGHAVCHRCKPYYFACPTCQSSLDVEIHPSEMGQYQMPPAMHYMPHPYPPYPPSTFPSAPFIEGEREHRWCPSPPTEHQELFPCRYSHLGCYAKVPEYLRELHESRCQLRPNLEDEHLPTDLSTDEGALENCKYSVVGCNVRLPEWRKLVHEEICIYKDRLEALESVQHNLGSLSFDDVDPEEKVECKFYRYGCMVKMPRRRKHLHEQKCNYQKHYREEDFGETISHNTEYEADPDEKVACRWSDYGCQVQPRRCRKENHEEKCNYRREKCTFAYNGCFEMVEPCKKHLHESSCSYNY